MAVSAELVDDCLRLLGPSHPYTLTARAHLARWQGESGDALRAVATGTELLDDQVRVLGADHPDTFITRNNLAHWR
ncbi:hypothetical protein AAH991_40390, partial [Microbispora sp. ZYX-F-249]